MTRTTDRLADRLADLTAKHTMANQRSFVADLQHARRLMWRSIGYIVLGISALFGVQLIPAGDGGVDTLLHSLSSIIVGVMIGLGGWGGIGRALAYRNGWLRGRAEMIEALAEAQARGIGPHGWLEAQLEKDMNIMLGGAASRERLDAIRKRHDDDN